MVGVDIYCSGVSERKMNSSASSFASADNSSSIADSRFLCDEFKRCPITFG